MVYSSLEYVRVCIEMIARVWTLDSPSLLPKLMGTHVTKVQNLLYPNDFYIFVFRVLPDNIPNHRYVYTSTKHFFLK